MCEKIMSCQCLADLYAQNFINQAPQQPNNLNNSTSLPSTLSPLSVSSLSSKADILKTLTMILKL
jgi:hypothetical protein